MDYDDDLIADLENYWTKDVYNDDDHKDYLENN